MTAVAETIVAPDHAEPGLPVSGDPISGVLISQLDPRTQGSRAADDWSGFWAPDEPIVGGPDGDPIGPPDRASIGVPDKEDPEVIGGKAFLAWWDANAQWVTDDAELFGLLEWRAQVHQDIIRRLYFQRSALLIQWRSEGLTLQQIADRSGLSYARVYELMPKHLRGRRKAGRGTDTAGIGAPDTSEIRGPDSSIIGEPDSEPVAA